MGRSQKRTIEDMQKVAEERGGKCLSPQYLGIKKKLIWECDKGHVWEAAPQNVVFNNSWCPFCAKKRKLTIEDMKAHATSRGGKCLSETYVDTNTHLTWQCAKGHVWNALPSAVIYGGTWCPSCRWGHAGPPESNFSRSEKALKKYASKNGWPSQSKWNTYAKEHGLLGVQSLYYHTKQNWEEYRKSLLIPPYSRTFTKDDCLSAIREAAKSLGQFFTRKQYDEWRKSHPDSPIYQQISGRCGGWNAAKTDAGLVPNTTWGKEFTEQEITEALRSCSRALGSLFSEEEYMAWRVGNSDIPHIETIRKRLGGLPEAKRKMDLESYDAGGSDFIYSEGRWREPFLRFLRDKLTHDTYEEWLKQNDGPSFHALRDHAGGYEKALSECLELYLEKIRAGRKKR